MVLRLFLDRGEAMLCEQNTYPHIYESMMHPTGLRAVPVAMDAQGMLPGALRETLEGFTARGERPPRLLYTVPVGQNPTGAHAAPAMRWHPSGGDETLIHQQQVRKFWTLPPRCNPIIGRF